MSETHKNTYREEKKDDISNDIGTSKTKTTVRMDIINMMARNSYRACNQLCRAQHVKEVWTAFELVQE